MGTVGSRSDSVGTNRISARATSRRAVSTSVLPFCSRWGCPRRTSSGPPRPPSGRPARRGARSEEHTSELQSRLHLVCRLLLEKKKNSLLVDGWVASRDERAPIDDAIRRFMRLVDRVSHRTAVARLRHVSLRDHTAVSSSLLRL